MSIEPVVGVGALEGSGDGGVADGGRLHAGGGSSEGGETAETGVTLASDESAVSVGVRAKGVV